MMAEADANVPSVQSREAEAVFKHIDTNGDRELDPRELQCRLSDFGVQDQNIELLFYRLDLNHDGVIDLEEFIAGYDQYLNLLQTGSFQTTTRELLPQHFLRTEDPIPKGSETVGWCGGNIRLYKSTYPANDPSEDRSTMVIGKDFVFAGVWDGHGGTSCSSFAEDKIFEHFKVALADPRCTGVQDAFAYSYITTDGEYLVQAGSEPSQLFAGTCAVGSYIDLNSKTISVSNLGDSRAVVGLFSRSSRGNHEDSQLVTIPMSKDHTAADDVERSRVESEHPNDPTCVVKMSEDDDDWRVKQIAAFTRSIGDCQMKDKGASTLYNTYTRRKVMPRPGVRAKGESEKTKPYIINAPDFCQHHNMDDGFLIVACDGVWDEMSSEEAVRIVAQLIVDNLGDDSVDIAELFIEEVLKKAVERCKDSYEEEEFLTLAALKARPCGKKDFSHRSCLHDDITVSILRFTTDDEDENDAERASAMKMAVDSAASTTAEQLTRMAGEIFTKIDVDGSGSITADELAVLAGRLGKPLKGDQLIAVMTELDTDQSGDVDFEEFKAWWPKYCQRMISKQRRTDFDGILGDIVKEVADAQSEEGRADVDQQIMEVIKFMDGKAAADLQSDFQALDIDESGELDLQEVRQLVERVFGHEVDSRVVAACFDQMDVDGSKAVDFDEFCSFFGVSK